ncbi:hypothetical protein E2C01_033134 [Portunus trituberculatus]|uniref:Uncharacterized protein n=1 Tax=Portunus trituberculatus TaxID=210409 RepID=A0A5B7F4U0_PORTR|nr:hypothetical protein [Portunus trituberculatus]
MTHRPPKCPSSLEGLSRVSQCPSLCLPPVLLHYGVHGHLQ